MFEDWSISWRYFLKIGWKGLILEEHVSPVIPRSLLNVTGNLKKVVCFGEHFLKILEFLVSHSDALNSKFGQKGWKLYFECQWL